VTAAAVVVPLPAARGGFAGTGVLLRLALARDRWMLPSLVLVFVAVAGFSAAAARDLYATTALMVTASEGWNSTAALVAVHGRIYDPSSLGSAALVKMTGIGTVLLALLTAFLVIRHTRADEEVGRTELAAGGVVGRQAPLVAALLVATLTTIAAAAGSGLALAAAGLPAAGSLAFAAAWIGAGLFFAALGAVAAQLAATARGARGLVAVSLGTAYLVRAVGDLQPDDGPRWLHWLSPLGWAQQVRPYADDRWWALLPLAAATGVLVAVAVGVLHRRDLGSGLLTPRPGPATSERLTGLGALSWRLHRPALLGWSAGLSLAGALLGSVAASASDLLTGARMQEYIELLGGTTVLEDAFLSAEIDMIALLVAGFGIATVLHLTHEEAQGRAEEVLSTTAGRTAYVMSHLGVALLGTAALLVLGGLASGASYAVTTGDPDQVVRVVGAALARLPAVWVLTAATVALFGLAPRAATAGWALLVTVLVLDEFGPLMDLPSWTRELTPFAHTPALPGGDLSAAPLLWLLGLAAVLGLLGAAAFRRRDLHGD
jgi:ABC-2 type transport system permease protein